MIKMLFMCLSMFLLASCEHQAGHRDYDGSHVEYVHTNSVRELYQDSKRNEACYSVEEVIGKIVIQGTIESGEGIKGSHDYYLRSPMGLYPIPVLEYDADDLNRPILMEGDLVLFSTIYNTTNPMYKLLQVAEPDSWVGCVYTTSYVYIDHVVISEIAEKSK